VAGGRPTVDSARVIADLRELARRTANERGAQRLCWSPPWREARALLGELLAELELEGETDEAGNLWARLEGTDPAAPALALGSHLDSVPDGGWLDGALGVMAAIGVLRAWADAGLRPPAPLVLVDWADEEGARFGRSLFGSSAFAGTLDPAALEQLRDADGRAIAEVLAENGVELARAGDCAGRREGLGAYLELHIEQGPRMEVDGLRAAAVTGCAGVERLRFEFRGQAAHAGTTPMTARHDAGLAAAEAALAIESIPEAEGGVATTGELRLEPGILSAVAGTAVLGVDLRHPEREPLARMLAAARERCSEVAASRGCVLAETPVFRIEPIPFDTRLVFIARAACAAVAGEPASLASGALHDAAEVARVLPAEMIFAPSRAGISHAREEDTAEADLAVAIEAYAELTARLLETGTEAPPSTKK
jgi:hydantoinase/carbamoylase family amidase